MTTPSGQISLNDVNVELGLSGTTLISMNDTNVRTLAGVASGAISMQNLQGKSNRVALSYTFSTSTQNASLNLSSISGYSSGKTDFTVTVNSGVYLWTDSTGSYGLNITGGTTGDTITIVNNGYIMGRGGNGGTGSGRQSPTAGGPALNLGFGMSSCTINHTSGTGYIGGGGGGGGGYYDGMSTAVGGGGAGGGAGGRPDGGSIGNVGGNGAFGNGGGAGGGGGGGCGGRIFPGDGGSGCGGANGGSSNASGTNSPSNYGCGGGGGGWGASGGNSGGGQQGGAGGGKAINTNSKSITYVSGVNARIWGAVN